MYGKRSATPHALQRLENTAQRLVLGAFCSHPLLFLRHDSNSVSTLQRLDAKTDSWVIRLLSLPLTNPAAQSIRKVIDYTGSWYLHPLSRIFSSPTSISGNLSHPIETVDTSLLSPPCPPWLYLCVERAVLAGLGRVKAVQAGPRSIIVYGAGMHIPNAGADAAAYAPLSRLSLSVHIDEVSLITSCKTESVALWLAVRLAKQLIRPTTTDTYIFSPSQTVIANLQHPSKPTLGQSLRWALWDYLLRFNSSVEPVVQIHLGWCPGNQGLDNCEKTIALAGLLSDPSKSPPTRSIRLPFSS